MNFKKVIKALNARKSFLIASHINPDCDALGCQLALARVLRAKGKKVYLIADSAVPAAYNFLPDIDKIKTNILSFKGSFEAALILDCPGLTRIGKVSALIKNHLIITIDHHPGKCLPPVNLCLKDPKSASTAEILYRLFKEMKVKIDKKTALLLYTGIATDTGFYKYPNTTSDVHKISAELIKLGVRPWQVASRLYESETLKRLKLLGLSLKTLKLHCGSKAAVMKVLNNMYEQTGTGSEHTDGFVNYPKSIKGVDLGILLRHDKQKGIVKASFRSKSRINVNKLAGIFKGGGHHRASGCTIRGNMDAVERMIIKEVKKIIR